MRSKYRMICDECHKMQDLAVLDMNYPWDGEDTIHFEGTCCNKNLWTENYLIKHPDFKYVVGYDKNGC